MTLQSAARIHLKPDTPRFCGVCFFWQHSEHTDSGDGPSCDFRQTEPQSADREFFIEERTASNLIIANDAYYRELIRNKTTRKQLRRTYPGFDWN